MSSGEELFSASESLGGVHSSRASSPDLSSEHSRIMAISLEDLRLGHRIHPMRKHAHCAGDIYLLIAFLDLAEVGDIDGNSVKLLLRTLSLLHDCSYSSLDICSIFAHASAYFLDVFAVCGGKMST